MSLQLFANNASTTLAGPITNTALNAALQSGSGVEFPSPGAAQFFLGTIVDAATGLLNEIVQVTARSGDTVTMVRAQEGTTALAWGAGDLFSNLWTAGSAARMLQVGQAALDNFAVAAGTNTYSLTWNLSQSTYAQGNPQGLVFFTNTNTSTTCTLNDGTGAKPLLKQNGSVPAIGDLVGYVPVFLDGSNWRAMEPLQSDIASQAAASGVTSFSTGYRYFNTAGAGTFTALYTGLHKITGWGGGGGGGYNSSNTVSAAGGGGGGGAGITYVYLTAGVAYPYVIGAGGTGGTSPSLATAGGTTSFNGTSLASGGSPGQSNATAGGAAGGGGSGNGVLTGPNSQNIPGQSGYQGFNVTVAQGGIGGNAASAPGAGYGGPLTAQNGNFGYSPGGGGSGAGQFGVGGNGAVGGLKIEW